MNRLAPSFPTITLAEIREVVKSTKQKSPGKSEITKAHIVNLPMNIITALRDIYNSALSLSYFPKIFKHGDIISLPKPNKSLHSHINYRPISLLEVPGEILEKIVNRKLLEMIETKGLHND